MKAINEMYIRAIKVVAGIIAACDMMCLAATVSDVTARQRYPWNGMVGIDYISEDENIFRMR